MSQRPVEWIGSSLPDLRAFPFEARRELGYDLFLVQQRAAARDWRPMASVGPGANEIRVRTWAGGRLEHRVVYVARFAEAIYVLHAFQKRSRRTSRTDIETARQRYRDMLNLREQRS